MTKGINAKSCMLHHNHASDTRQEKPTECSNHRIHAGVCCVSVPNQSRNDETYNEGNGVNPFVLPHHEFVFFQILNVLGGSVRFELEHEPTHVSPEKTLGYVVGVVVGIDMLVMLAVFGTPPKGRIFKRSGTEKQNE